MATANEKIRDALIRRQMESTRAGVGLGQSMRRLLSKLDGDLRVLIEERVDPITGNRVKFGKTRRKRLQAIQEAIKDLQRPTYTQIRANLKAAMVEVGEAEAIFTAGTISAQLPTVVNLALPSTALLRTIATSKPFEGKVMSRHMSTIEGRDATRMMDQIRIGMVSGENSQQITRRVFGTSTQGFNNGTRALTKRNVEAISRTAINFITNQSRTELYLANRKIVPKEVYVATLDGRTTLQCIGLDGTVFDVGEGEIPPVHFNCRSLRVPAVNGKAIGTRPANATTKQMLQGMTRKERRSTINSLTGTVPATESYQVFLRKQPVAFQNDVLGKTKATLFRKGGVSVDKFTDPTGKTLTISQLKRQQPEAFIKAGLQEVE